MQTNDWRYYARLMAGVALVSIAGPALGVGAAILLGVQNAYPHEALPTAAKPQGWTYQFSCCGAYDCRAIGDSRSSERERVFETADGYSFSTSTEVIPYTDSRVKDSPDGLFHWCTVAGKSDGKTICLYVPPRGS
jgi:hypothetical protein